VQVTGTNNDLNTKGTIVRDIPGTIFEKLSLSPTMNSNMVGTIAGDSLYNVVFATHNEFITIVGDIPGIYGNCIATRNDL
jgi:hypothetical protein